jgi:uncharacterized secreted protein with C-terminal beta-propeller domain
MKTLRLFAPALLAWSAPLLASAQLNFVDIAHTNNGSTAQALAISGNYAYLAAGTNGLLVYDISHPTNPVNIGHFVTNFDLEISTYAVVVSGNYVYETTMSPEGGGLYVFDVSNPAAPANIFHTNLNIFGGIAVSGTNLYLGGDSRLPDFGISNPAAPTLITNEIEATAVRKA